MGPEGEGGLWGQKGREGRGARRGGRWEAITDRR